MNEEKARIKNIRVEWTDGIIESIGIPQFISSITIDVGKEKRWGVLP